MQLKPLYDVKLIEQNRQHYYQIGTDEVWKPGVTTVLKVLDKPALIPWAAKCVSDNIKESLNNWDFSQPLGKLDIGRICEEGKNIYKKKASDAADMGSRVHKAIDEIIRGEIRDYSPDVRAGVQGFEEWKASNSLKIELGDTKIGSKMFGYGGSLDMVAFNEKNEAIIFDFKTTRIRKGLDHGIYPEAAYQLAAYSWAFREIYGIEVKEVYGLWLNKEKPEFKAVKVANIPACFEIFLSCLKIYNNSKFEMFEDMILV